MSNPYANSDPCELTDAPRPKAQDPLPLGLRSCQPDSTCIFRAEFVFCRDAVVSPFRGREGDYMAAFEEYAARTADGLFTCFVFGAVIC